MQNWKHGSFSPGWEKQDCLGHIRPIAACSFLRCPVVRWTFKPNLLSLSQHFSISLKCPTCLQSLTWNMTEQQKLRFKQGTTSVCLELIIGKVHLQTNMNKHSPPETFSLDRRIFMRSISLLRTRSWKVMCRSHFSFFKACFYSGVIITSPEVKAGYIPWDWFIHIQSIPFSRQHFHHSRKLNESGSCLPLAAVLLSRGPGWSMVWSEVKAVEDGRGLSLEFLHSEQVRKQTQICSVSRELRTEGTGSIA